MLPTASLETLPNGLKLVLVPDDHVESACFGLFVASGSRHEAAKDAGISHFIEHMLFKGTATRSALAISQAIEGRGGNFNAYTSEEGTCFYAYLPCDYLPTAVDIISDMFVNAASLATGDARTTDSLREHNLGSLEYAVKWLFGVNGTRVEDTVYMPAHKSLSGERGE